MLYVRAVKYDTTHTCPVVEMPKELSKAGFTVTEHHLEIAESVETVRIK